nr:GGDEF domain-containing protein [uncultured Rhodoferax sp.]
MTLIAPPTKSTLLLQHVEAELLHPSRRLRFAPEIEAQYEAETGKVRNHQIYMAGMVALLVFNAFLWNDFRVRSAIFYDVLFVRLLLVTAPCFGILWLIRRGVTPSAREILTGCGVLMVTAAASWINWQTRSDIAGYDCFTFVLVLITSNIALPIRFTTATITSVLSAIIVMLSVLWHPYIPAQAQIVSLLVYVFAGVFTLLAKYRLELAERKSYLNYLRETLRNQEMQEANLSLQRISNCDPLTGLSNRRRFDEAFLAATNQRSGGPDKLVILMVDIDHFKPYNDTFGHPAGDQCLQTVANLINEQVRDDKDVVARIGGEEFAVLLLEASMQEALQVAERVRTAVQSAMIPHDGREGRQWVSISIGVAQAHTRDVDSVRSVMRRADEALYLAKNSGRNCVRVDDKP